MASISVRQSIAWLPAAPSEPTSTTVLTSPGRRFVDVRILRAGNALEWALAGTSSSTPVGNGITDCIWRHWVDSRHADADAQVDRGRNTEQPDGTVRETGSMANPETGRVQAYEEVWRDEVLPQGSRCVVLQHEAGADRGVVMVLGPCCQGIARTADSVTAERWHKTATDHSDDSWHQVFRHGEGQLPCREAIAGAGSLNEGETVTAAGRTWHVVEAAPA